MSGPKSVAGRDSVGQQVLIEAGRTAHGLAGVVHDDVEPRERVLDIAREDLDARRVAQIEAVDVEAVFPFPEVGLARVAQRRVLGEARGGDDFAARPEHLERGLEADLHARSGDKADAAFEGGRLEPLRVVEVGALRAHRVVEVVELRELRLADVAGPRLLQLAGRGGLGLTHQGRGHEHRGFTRLADSGHRP